ncbi:hypothetical protein FRC17_002410, partial [Serendipita sp. 399]
MDFLIALRGTAEAPQQSPNETITKLADRLAQSTQLEDRRAALLSLRGLSKDYRAEVGTIALESLLLVLDGDAQVDPEVAKALLQTLNTLCEVNGSLDGTAEQRDMALRNTDLVLKDPKYTQKLFGLLNDASFYTRYGALQLLNTLVSNRRTVVQNHFVNAPEYSQTVTSILEEKRDMIRNEGLQLFQALVAQNTDIQTVFAFGGAFESLLRIIAQEGSVEGGVAAYGCLLAIEGLLKYNSSTQTYFRQLLPSLPPLLLFPPSIAPDQESPQEFTLQYWDEMKAQNAGVVVSIIGIMKAPEHIRLLTELGIVSNAPPQIKAQALRLLSSYNQTPPFFQTVTPYVPVPESNGDEWDRLEPRRGIDLLVSTALDGEYGGVGVTTPTNKGTMNLRGIALTVFDDFVKDEESATDLLNGMLQQPQSIPPASASGLLLYGIQTLPTSPLTSSVATRLQFACLLFSALFHGPPNHSNTSPKAIARAVGGSSSAPQDGSGGNFFVPADNPVSSAPTTTLRAAEDEEDPPSSLLQLLTEHLSLSMLARAKVIDDAIESRLWDKIIVGYLVLLCTWLWEDPKSIRIFLEAGGVGVLVEPISQTSGIDVLVQGLCAFLFAICYHFNREPGEITRKTLHPIITRLGADQLVSRMARARDDDRFRHVNPDSIVLPVPPSLVISSKVVEGEIWLDWGFVEFWKANYYTAQRGLGADPDTVASGPGDTTELQLVIASLRDVVRKQADELQAAKAETAEAKRQHQLLTAKGAAGDDLQKKLEVVQVEKDAEREALQKQINELTYQISELQEKKKDQEKEQEDLLVFLEEMSEKRRRDKAAMRAAGLDVSEDEGGDEGDKPVVHIEHADVYKWGSVDPKDAIFRNLSWTVKPGEAWVIISQSSECRGELFQMLLGKRRIQPRSSNGLFPFLEPGSPSVTPPTEFRKDNVLHVAFTASKPIATAGEFTDYSARYGAMRDQDRQTLQESLLESLSQDPAPPPPTEFTPRDNPSFREGAEILNAQVAVIQDMAAKLGLLAQLDIPFIALSNGQQRRARILRQLIRHPRILLLQDPFAGLDYIQRPILSDLLQGLNQSEHPFIIMELRPQDPIPRWITHVALVQNQRLTIMSGAEYHHDSSSAARGSHGSSPKDSSSAAGKEIASLNDVKVTYDDRQVLKNITWTIRGGDRWWLRGPNGSGKTTLISMLTGEHPQSYIQKNFSLLGRPRRSIPTVSIQKQISVFTPEIFAAFPRRSGPGGLTVVDAIGTGFEGTYSYRPLSAEQKARVDLLIQKLAPGRTKEDRNLWGDQIFASLSPQEQSLALLMRTLVGGASLIILDEAFAGMDDGMIHRISKYLQEDISPDQAVIFVSHWEHEVPWSNAKQYTIQDGIGQVVNSRY